MQGILGRTVSFLPKEIGRISGGETNSHRSPVVSWVQRVQRVISSPISCANPAMHVNAVWGKGIADDRDVGGAASGWVWLCESA